MATALDGMPSFWGLRDPVSINPCHASSHHAKVQMIADRLRMSGLRFGATDIAFKGSRKNNTTLIEANIFIMRAAIKSVATINSFITNKNTTKSI